jgi:cadmium resistance protein CadD (predicted permease)
MTSFLSELGIGIVVFASTNIDDMFVLAAFFADPHRSRRSIVVGQYLGIGALVAASAVAALLALAVPEGWVALLGLAPLLLGLSKLGALRRVAVESATEGEISMNGQQRSAGGGLWSQALAVAGTTVANGGDNIGVYVPLFASALDAMATYAITFAVMTGAWCGLGYLLVNNRFVGGSMRRYGHILLPVVLIGLGLYILSGALVLLR